MDQQFLKHFPKILLTLNTHTYHSFTKSQQYFARLIDWHDTWFSSRYRSNASTDSGLKSAVHQPVPSSEEEVGSSHLQLEGSNHLGKLQFLTKCFEFDKPMTKKMIFTFFVGLLGSNHQLDSDASRTSGSHQQHHPLFKKNSTIITCTHHKGMKCAQMTLTRHYSLSSLLEALPAASVDAEADLEKHASISSLSSGSRYSDYDGYFYI